MEGPQVTLPKEVNVSKKEGPDFLLYYFTGPRKQVLFAYVGFAPSFPDGIPKSVKPRKGEINSMEETTYSWKRNKTQFFRETLIKTGRHDFAEYVHFSYSRLNASEAKVSDAIIASTLRSAQKPQP